MWGSLKKHPTQLFSHKGALLVTLSAEALSLQMSFHLHKMELLMGEVPGHISNCSSADHKSVSLIVFFSFNSHFLSPSPMYNFKLTSLSNSTFVVFSIYFLLLLLTWLEQPECYYATIFPPSNRLVHYFFNSAPFKLSEHRQSVAKFLERMQEEQPLAQ